MEILTISIGIFLMYIAGGIGTAMAFVVFWKYYLKKEDKFFRDYTHLLGCILFWPIVMKRMSNHKDDDND